MRKLSILNPTPTNMQKNPLTDGYNNANLIKITTAITAGTKAELDFKGYENLSNKEMIRAIADGCCGYCGVRIDEHNTTVVEHFKPKAELHFRQNEIRLDGVEVEALERSGTFKKDAAKCSYGYFMDGNYAENLLPSCNACNTGAGNNGTFVHNKKAKGNIEYKIPYGKNNFFPILYSERNNDGKLHDHRKNELYISNLATDKALLFNPYFDDPYELFSVEFDDTFVAANGVGYIIKIKPKKRASKFNRLKAQASINLLGLNRANLCIERYKKYEAIAKIRSELIEAYQNNNFDPNIWSKLALDFSKEFNISNAQMLGYGKYFGKTIGFKLRDIIIDKFPLQSSIILNHGISFEELITQLQIFAQYYYIPVQTNQAIRNIQERILLNI